MLKIIKKELDKLMSQASIYSESPLFREFLEEKVNDYLELTRIVPNVITPTRETVKGYIRAHKLDAKYIHMINDPEKYFKLPEIKVALISCGY